MQKDRNMKGPNAQYDEVEMMPKSEFIPKTTHYKPSNEPQQEMCGVGMTSSNVAMEENPAYQSVDVAAAKS